MGFVFYYADERLHGEGSIPRGYQGPPGHAHGGSLAAILDELMGLLLWRLGHKVVAVHLDFDYRHPTPLETPLKAESWIVDRGRRSITVASRLVLPDGSTAVEGKGVFVELGDEFVRRFGDAWYTKAKPQSPG
jgi:acyl-coenzyme A thioesterase PaaI-like protein